LSINISNQEKQEFLNVAIEAARLGGDKLIEWMGKVDVREKGPRDLVTQADFESQQVISDYLLGKFPDHQFLGEESTEKTFESKKDVFCWVVDPLDGTVNYVHQLNSFSVSIALRLGDETIVGVVLVSPAASIGIIPKSSDFSGSLAKPPAFGDLVLPH
jgi:myo-inositol-1(or 4)-monophosphatase